MVGDGIIKQLNGDTKNIEGATYLTPFVATDTSEKVQAFVNTYKESTTQNLISLLLMVTMRYMLLRRLLKKQEMILQMKH